MNVARFLVYLGGLVLVLVAVWLLFFETGINRWVPFSILAVVVLLIAGLGVMGGADKLSGDRVEESRVVEERRV